MIDTPSNRPSKASRNSGDVVTLDDIDRIQVQLTDALRNQQQGQGPGGTLVNHTLVIPPDTNTSVFDRLQNSNLKYRSKLEEMQETLRDEPPRP